jgi:xylose isomerase
VHLNDQNGLKFDQDRSFGSVDLRRAFNQVRVLDENQYWTVGMVGMDVKAVRTQPSRTGNKTSAQQPAGVLAVGRIIQIVGSESL